MAFVSAMCKGHALAYLWSCPAAVKHCFTFPPPPSKGPGLPWGPWNKLSQESQYQASLSRRAGLCSCCTFAEHINWKGMGGGGMWKKERYNSIWIFAAKKKPKLYCRKRITASWLDNLEITSWYFTLFLKTLCFRKAAKELAVYKWLW